MATHIEDTIVSPVDYLHSEDNVVLDLLLLQMAVHAVDVQCSVALYLAVLNNHYPQLDFAAVVVVVAAAVVAAVVVVAVVVAAAAAAVTLVVVICHIHDLMADKKKF